MLNVRNLNKFDYSVVLEMDLNSDFNVSEFIEGPEESLSYGIFLDEILIGYATLGYANCCSEIIADHPAHSNNSIILSNVFIDKAHRKNGYSLILISEALKQGNPNKESVYLSVLYPGLIHFYKKFGFVEIGDNCMFKEFDNQSLVKCLLCKSEISWTHKNETMHSSDYLENIDICKTCLIDHCCETDCDSCSIRNVSNCEFKEIKIHYSKAN